MGLSNETVMFTVEAKERASGILEKVSAAFERMGKAGASSGKEAAKSVEELEAAQSRAAAASREYERALSSQRAAQSELTASSQKVERAEKMKADAAKMSGAESAEAQRVAAQAYSTASLEEEAALARVKTAEEAAAKKAEESSAVQVRSTESAHSGWSKAATGVAVAGLAMGAVAFEVGKHSVEAANEYQASTSVLAANANISMGAAQKVGQAFLTTAGQSTFSAQEMMQAYGPVSGVFTQVAGHALSSGEALKVMKASTDLAEASGESLSSTTKTLAGVLLTYHMGAAGAGAASDILENTSRMTGVSVSQLGAAFDKLKGRLGVAAPSLADTGVLVTELSKAGVTGSRGVMMVNTAMQTMMSTSKPVKAEIQQLGLHLYTASGKFVGMGSVIQQLGPKLKGMSDAQRQAAESTLFGRTAAGAMDGVLRQGTAAWNKNREAVIEAGGAHEAAEKKAATFEGQMKKIKASVHDAAISLGTALLPMVQKFMSVVMSILGPILHWVTTHQKLAGTILLVGGVLGTLIGTIIMAVLAFSKVKVAMQAAEIGMKGLMTASGIGLILMILVTVAVLIATHWTQTKAVLAAIWNWIKSAAESVAHFFVGVWQGAVNIFKTVWNAMLGFIKSWWPLLIGIILGPIGIIIGLFIKFHSQIFAWFKKIWDDVKGIAKHLWEDVVGFFTNLWHDITGLAKKMWDAEVNGWKKIWTDVKGIATNLWHDVVNFFKNLYNDLVSIQIKVHNWMVDLWNKIWTAIKNIAKNLWTDVKNFFKNLYNDLVDIHNRMHQWLVDLWNKIWNKIKSIASNLWRDVKNFFINLYNDLVSIQTKVHNWMVDLWNKIWNKIKSIAKGLWDDVKGIFTRLWNDLKRIGTNLWNDLTKIWTNIKNNATHILDDLKKAFGTPIEFVVRTVFNNGLLKGINKLLGVVGIHTDLHIPDPNLPTFAQGGLIGGTGMGDTQHILATAGESVLTVNATKNLGGATGIDAINRAFGGGGSPSMIGGLPAFNGGGNIVSDIFSTIKHVGSDALGSVKALGSAGKDVVTGHFGQAGTDLSRAGKDAWAGVKDATLGGLRIAAKTFFDVILNPIIGQIGGHLGGKVRGGIMSQMLPKEMHNVENSVLKFLGDKDNSANGSFNGKGGPAPAGQINDWIMQALHILGYPASYAAGLYHQIMTESTGNPAAIQGNIGDVNNASGDLAKGIMQVISTTFAANALPGHTNIFNPVDNIIAGARHAMSSPSEGPGWFADGPWHNHGYDNGGGLPPGFTMAYNGTGQTEYVFTGSQLRNMGGGGATVVLDIHDNNLMSDRDMDVLIDKLGRRMATFTIPAAGIRIGR